MTREIPVVIKSQNQQIVGIWHQPKRKGPHPAVLILHGFTGSSHEAHRIFVDAARALVDRGIGALRIDFRGSGNSEGHFGDMTLKGELADAHAALRWLRRQPEVDRKRIGLLGMSMGGLISLHTLATDHAVKAATLWNPAVQPKVLRAAWLTPERKKQVAKTGIAEYGGWALGREFLNDLISFDPAAIITRVKTPVCFVLGTNDQTCNPAGSEKYCQIMRKAGQDVAMAKVSGADHCFSSFAWKRAAIDATVNWFTERL